MNVLLILLLMLLPSLATANDYYTHGSFPATGSAATSAGMRAELDLITAGFDKMPALTGNASRAVIVNGAGTALALTTGTLTLPGNFALSGANNVTLTSTGATNVTLPTTGTLSTLAGAESLSNKTVVAPVLSGSMTGTYTLAGTPTITSPTISSPTISTPTFSGTAGGSLTSLALTSPVITTGTVAADPSASLGIVSKQYADAHGFTTGDVKLTLKTVADTGWVLMNDGTIGNAASGGTSRANADTADLYTLIWNNCADAQCAVSTGRGASAAADYAANKTIALPKALGRALATYGTGSGLTARVMGQTLGAQDAVVVSHNHTASSTSTVTDPGHTHTVTNGTSVVRNIAGAVSAGGGDKGSSTLSAASNTTGVTVDTTTTVNSAGVSATDANMQPTAFLNVMVKL